MASLPWVIVLTFSAVISVTGQDSSCPPGFIANDVSCYAYIDHAQSWADAESTCAALGGFLPEVYSQNDNDFLKKMATDHGGDAIWIGGEDLVSENKWTWAKSGSLITEYTDWAPNQPDDGGDENCMELNVHHYSGHWNDDQCSHKQPFICQRYMGDSLIG